MPVIINASVVLAGKGYENFSGIFCISFPEMMICERVLTFLATKTIEKGNLVVVIFRDGEPLFTIIDEDDEGFTVQTEEVYGNSLDGKPNKSVNIALSLKEIVSSIIKELEDAAAKDISAFKKTVNCSFFIEDCGDERAQEILCLICRDKRKESISR